jgi:integrase
LKFFLLKSSNRPIEIAGPYQTCYFFLWRRDVNTKHAHYSLYKKRIGTRDYWYVRYWNEREKRYSAHRSTGVEAAGKKGRRAEADRIALEMLPAICFNTTNMTMLQYVKKFWQPDSPYFREHERVLGHKLSASYSKAHLDVIRLHVEPYPPFARIGMEKLSVALARDWMLWLAERGASGSRINRAMQALRVPLRYAIERDEVKLDPFAKIRPAHEVKREKGVLTKKEVIALINAPVSDPKRRLAVLLGVLCGMRLGEVRGLHWDDLDPQAGVVHIRHNWQDLEGIKAPKCGSDRDVPLPSAVCEAAAACREQAAGPLVFGRKDSKPLCNGHFRLALIAELAIIGVNKRVGKTAIDDSEQRERNITFHSLRHTFVSLARLAGIGDFQVQALAGHKSSAMMEHYSHRGSSAMMEHYSHRGKVIEVAECGKIIEGFFKTA